VEFVMGFFGLFAVSEVHHVIESIVTREYDPGVVTCVPYAVVGVLMLRAVWWEFQRLRGTVAGTGLVTVAQGKGAVL